MSAIPHIPSAENKDLPYPLPVFCKMEKEAKYLVDLVQKSLFHRNFSPVQRLLVDKAEEKFLSLPERIRDFASKDCRSSQKAYLQDLRHFLFELSHLLRLLHLHKILSDQRNEKTSHCLLNFSRIVLQSEMLY